MGTTIELGETKNPQLSFLSKLVDCTRTKTGRTRRLKREMTPFTIAKSLTCVADCAMYVRNSLLYRILVLDSLLAREAIWTPGMSS